MIFRIPMLTADQVTSSQSMELLGMPLKQGFFHEVLRITVILLGITKTFIGFYVDFQSAPPSGSRKAFQNSCRMLEATRERRRIEEVLGKSQEVLGKS